VLLAALAADYCSSTARTGSYEAHVGAGRERSAATLAGWTRRRLRPPLNMYMACTCWQLYGRRGAY
jgi:hypothetical protein